MTFIVTLVALLIERFFDWSHIRNWTWFKKFQYAVSMHFQNSSPYYILAVTILPIVALTAVIQFVLDDWLYGLINLVFQLVLLIYCLGPKNLWAEGFASINSLTAENAKSAFGLDSSNQSLHKQLLNKIFVEANRRVFAVIFWYIVLGPLGAVLYRTVSLTAQEEAKPVIIAAETAENILDWLPARLFTFLFALGGHFVQVLDCWRKKVLIGPDGNEVILTECGSAALGGDGQDDALIQDGTIQRQAISLLDRVFIITLVIIALSVLLG